MSAYTRLLDTHAKVYKATDGRLGHRLLGVPTLLLHTQGRKTGIARSSALVYARDGADLLVVASNGGSDRPPAWLLNLTADDSVEAQIGRKRSPAKARTVFPGDPDYDRLIGLCNANNSNRYATYRQRTERPIPVVVITPESSLTPGR